MKRALITGGSRGLGLALVQRLLCSDWEVTACARNRTPEVAQLESECSDRFRFLTADLGASDGALALAESAGALSGYDALVANAAVGTEGLLTLTSEASIRGCIEVNVVSVMLLAREMIKGMLTRGKGGSLVFVSSVAARTGMSGLSVYSATKGALLAFSRSVAREYGARGIRSNCVLPGFLETEMSAALGPDARAGLVRRTALKRLGAVNDIVGMVAFLVSDEAGFATGSEWVVDGGLTA